MYSRYLSHFLSMFGIAHPIIQAPMAGGATTPELVAAVSNAGALGSFAAATLSPAAMIEGVQKVRALTGRPFNVNLFVLAEPVVDQAGLAAAQARLHPYRAALGLADAVRPAKFCENNQAQIAALLELAPPVVSFTFGLLDADTVAQFRQKGSLVIGTATTVAEARAWEAVGADAICIQGIEAGGHRGTFLGDFEQSGIGLMALIPQVARAVNVPLIAAGGIMDGKGIAAALILGARAAQLGTAFLCCPEAGIHPGWKQRIAHTSDDGTRLTRVFSGKYARGIVTDFMQQLRPFEQDVPPYPIQNALTADIRQAAAKQGQLELMSLWAGQGAGLARTLSAAQLVQTLADELAIALPGR
ncbi:nitronate monooxygenase family protein [Herminiimonas sp. CN]|uniref:NAD(P)H-dependent flavin oxidoreductase n=1 Tax=Herminiimonas sp. CN TaxID=1349818 RepID=UPI000473D4AD|nr:nitronate monooxygenase [Herminiimonas sp. CN]